jgi:hypothetical protein
MEGIMSGLNVDALIRQWAERGFNQSPVRRSSAGRGLTGLTIRKRAQWTSTQTGASGVRAGLERIARRTPQVIVRISGGGRGMSHIRAHLSYITRNGRLPAFDQNEDRFHGRDELAELGQELQSGGFPIAESSETREALNIILSMPEGTDAAGLRRAAMLFAADEFEGHQYALVLHTFDTDPHKNPARHPHIHLCVKRTGEDGTRLNPRKPDLQRWRERFAERLREHGIDAAASYRLERLQRDRGPKPSVWQMAHRGAPMHSIGVSKATGERLTRALQLEAHMLERYGELAHILARSADQQDRRLAMALTTVLRDDRRDMDKPRADPDR